MTATRSRARRAALPLVGALGLTLVLAALALLNAQRLGGRRFDRAAEELVSRARQVAARTHPGYQREALAAIGPGSSNGWFVRLDDALGEGRDGVARDDAAGDPAGALWSLEFDDAESLLALPPGSQAPRVADGWLGTSEAWPVAVTHRSPVAIPVQEIGEIHLAVRNATTPQIILGWTTEEDFPAEPVRLYGPTTAIDLVPGGGADVYRIDPGALRRRTASDAVIRRFFLATATVPGSSAEVDYLRIVSRSASLIARETGTTYQMLDGELRPAAFAAGSRALEFPLELPTGEVRLDFALGLLGGDGAAPARVEIATEGGREVLFERSVSAGAAWSEATVDLSAWAGREIRLLLSSAAREDQVALWASPVVRGERARRLNVVVFLDDTLRADHVSALGYGRDTTPALRDFAGDAVVFTRAISQATKTRPSVASLMTSLPPTATGVAAFWERLGDGYLTLAEVLRRQGFLCAAFLQNGSAGVAAGLHQGFDLSRLDESVGLRPADVVEGAAIPWLRRNAGRNFFLYVHVIDPHDPYEPLPPDDAWASGLEGDERVARYDGEIRMADRAFGRFADVLDELGLAEDTLVVFLSDHGEYLGEDGRWGHEPPGDPPVTHVPLALRYPAGLEARRVDEPVQLLDVMPTILELTGTDPRLLAMTGSSLARLARTGADPALSARMLVSQEPTRHPIELRGRADATGSLIFDGWQLQRSRARRPGWARWLLGFHPSSGPGRGRDLLLTLDPWTRRRISSLTLRWQSALLETRASYAGLAPDAVRLDPDVNERLRALGYIQ